MVKYQMENAGVKSRQNRLMKLASRFNRPELSGTITPIFWKERTHSLVLLHDGTGQEEQLLRFSAARRWNQSGRCAQSK